MAEISRVEQNRKGFIKYNNHLTINHKVFPGKYFCSYIAVTEIQKLPTISSKNNSDKLSWPAGVGLLKENNEGRMQEEKYQLQKQQEEKKKKRKTSSQICF